MTKIAKKSQLTGKINERNIPVDSNKLVDWLGLDEKTRPAAQDHFPELSADDREFLMTGMTPEEFEEATGSEEVADEVADEVVESSEDDVVQDGVGESPT